MSARMLCLWLALLLSAVALLGACGYTGTCTYQNRTSFRLNVYEAYAGVDGVPKRAPGLVRELEPLGTGQGACGAPASDTDYFIYFEARSFSGPAGRLGEAAGEVIWSEVVSRMELERRGMRVVIEEAGGTRTVVTPTVSTSGR